MTANRFGGMWTASKLAVLREYIGFYATALKSQPFQLVYIDAFAGTGRCHISVGEGRREIIDGSAKIALDSAPTFSRYHFIERKKKHQLELQALIDGHSNGSRARLHPGSAEDMLPPILLGYDWARHRGVLFLDPFGLQCSWALLKRIAETRALDVFFLLSLAGLYRQAAVNVNDIDEGKASTLTRMLGTDEWRAALYKRQVSEPDLFGYTVETTTRERGYQGVLDFATKRLRSLFPYVAEPNLLGVANGAPLFALYFAIANPAPAAIGLASRVSKDILSKLR